MKRHLFCQSLAVACACYAYAGEPSAFVTEVVSYEPGFPVPFLNDPSVVIGSPTRFTGIGIFPAVVSVFNPPWSDTDIVSIAPGGQLTVRFDSPVTNHPNNPFGIDLLIFNNTGFEDISYPNGIVGGLFGDDGGVVHVSADGDTWHAVDIAYADGMFPSQGYLDSAAYDEQPGVIPADFTKPVNPSLTFADFNGLSFDQVMELYNGSGGGAGVDIATTGLSEILYVRISNPAGAVGTVEIDGLSRVSPVVLGDLNGDGIVDVTDLLTLLSTWGGCPLASCPADLSGDLVVDVEDLLILLAHWG